MKAVSDTMFGAYDRDAQAHVTNKLMGIAFMQFMTYWPAKMKLWFAKPDPNNDAVGHFEQAFDFDEKGNKKLLYRKEIMNPDGTPG